MFLFGEAKLAAPSQAGIQTLLWTELYTHAPCENFAADFWDVERPRDTRFEVARLVDDWREAAAGVYMDMLRALCQNPCRIRRCLVNVLQDADLLNGKVAPLSRRHP